MNLHLIGNLEMKFTNFNDQEAGKKLTLDELGGKVSIKYAASLKNFHCSDSNPSSNCTNIGHIPNKIDCSLSDSYGYQISLARCTTADHSCTKTCTSDAAFASLCES